MPVILAPLIAWLIRALTMMLAVKGVLFVVKLMGLIGIAFATNEYVLEPLLDTIMTQYNAIPQDVRSWMRAFGVTEAFSIFVSTYTIIGAQRVFLTAIRQ